MSRIESLCQIVHETDSVTSVTFLETLVQRFKTFHSNYLLPSRTLEVVVKENGHFKGQIPSIMGGDNHFHNRCFEHGVRGFIEKKIIMGSGQRTKHLFISITWNLRQFTSHLCSFFHIWTPPPQKVLVWCDNTTVVQFINKIGEQIHQHLFKSLESVEIRKSKLHNAASCSYSMSFEFNRRSSLQWKDSIHRIVSEHSGTESNIIGEINYRFIWFDMESQDSDLLFMDSRSEGTSNRCIVNFVGQDDSICVSPNMSCSENFITHKAISVSKNSQIVQNFWQNCIKKIYSIEL